MKKTTIFIFALCSCVLASAQSHFDNHHVVCSFGVVSDVHIDTPDGDAANKFRNALKRLKDMASKDDANGLDAVLVAGDLADSPCKIEGSYYQVDYFKTIYETEFNPVETPLIYTPGNHDTYKWWTPETISQAKNISDRFGPDYFLTDMDNDAREKMECRHCIVGDYHILTIVPIGASPVVYSPDALAWIDRQLASVTASDPGRFVLLITHPMVYDTVYGSMLGNYWATSELTRILEKYPQVVTFSGHLHFPLNDPRSIWQGKFTSLGCGSVRYMAIEDGQYEEMSSKTVMKDCNEFSQGLLVQFDRNGNLRITRMDFYHNDTIGKPWTVQSPQKDLSHLKTYTFSSRKASNSAPGLHGMKIAKKTDGITVSFRRGSDDEFVHHYIIDVTSADTLVARKKILADFYKCTKPSRMKKEWTIDFNGLQPGTYKASLLAVDSWGAESNSVSETFNILEGK